MLSPRGDPGNPLTPEEVTQKFVTLAGAVLDRGAVAKVLETVHTMEAVPYIGALTELLVAA